MRVQLWSYNYDPEPTGIGPLSTVLANQLSARGHAVSVVAAHPHYPEPVWGSCRTPYRERRGDVGVLRLPLWPGRGSALARVRQELTFTGAMASAAPLLPTPDVVVAVSPSFPALGPAMLNARARRIPLVIWLQDILPDAATATGIIEEGRLIRLARRFEQLAYRSAARVVVISDSFAMNLRSKGVPGEKMVRIYNPATRLVADEQRAAAGRTGVNVLTMGNIGHTQNLVAVTEAFERSAELRELGARFVIAGDGVAGDEVRRAITTDRVEITGVLDSDDLERRLSDATVALVSQRYEGIDFNVPSKLMNFMAYGLPVLGSVRAESEVAQILNESGGGWVTDCGDVDRGMSALAAILRDASERHRRGSAARDFALDRFAPEKFGAQFERALAEVVDVSRPHGAAARRAAGRSRRLVAVADPLIEPNSDQASVPA